MIGSKGSLNADHCEKEKVVFKKITLEKLGDLVSALKEKGPLYAPVRDGKAVNFQKITKTADVTLDFYNTVFSPKFVFFPQTEDLIRYTLQKEGAQAEPVPIAASPSVILGVRPCDAKSFEIMDRHFLGAGIIDPYWKNRRDNTVVIGYAFDPAAPPDPADFYNTVGIHAADTEGSDVFMVRKDGELLLKGITKKGESLLKGLAVLDAASAQDEAFFDETIRKDRGVKTRFTEITDTAIAAKLVGSFEKQEIWEEMTASCIGCGTCTFVCPTCYCFDINDETLFRKGARKRFWDACMFTDFTLEASGHNPRPRIFQRYRQKVCHKYSYHVTKYGCISCVGCGRCTRSCPVNIDIFSIVEKVANL
ncbi:MAG: 4Fe-4S dicluster domain-containing protein [Deltaproteobacteria bacterium]|nr:4Fe-4S dicluster domain-containing protein [Deltaproteobacteria bacterium]